MPRLQPALTDLRALRDAEHRLRAAHAAREARCHAAMAPFRSAAAFGDVRLIDPRLFRDARQRRFFFLTMPLAFDR